jgi:6-phosphofructokinase 1
MPDFRIPKLGPARHPSPISISGEGVWTADDDLVPSHQGLKALFSKIQANEPIEGFEIAGPRAELFFNPADVRAAVVTCGGLCPGLNAVIRAIVMQLYHRYGCTYVEGIRQGFHGLARERVNDFFVLSPEIVENIHMQGGTILGTSRGTPATSEIVDSLIQKKINVFFAIGGDGTLRGAAAIADEIKRRGQYISVIGVPKTIDNDIPWVRRTFGFETAVSVAVDAVKAAHVEAVSVVNGIGLVKLMGRDSGYIAANATLASGDVNYCLVPELDFNLEGSRGLIELLVKRISSREHAVIVVAEGAGQKFFRDRSDYNEERDASGNVKLGDIGTFLRDEIRRSFKERNIPITLKYIDPSYIIRTSAGNAGDQLFCARLAQNAVHAAMSGRTSMLVGYWHGRMTHVPFSALVGRQKINPGGELWFNVLETTGQPSKMT